MPVLRRLKVDIPLGEVLRLLGYAQGHEPHPKLKQVIAKQIEMAHDLIRPQAIYSLVRIWEIGDSRLVLEGGCQLSVGHRVGEWQGSEYLGLALCTIGSLLETEVSQWLASGNLAAATYLDATGSVATEGLARLVYSHLCQWAQHRGLNSGLRLSPGYGDWPLSDQEQLFHLLPVEKIGISLNSHCLMLPLKSVSFAIGIGKALKSNEDEPCRYCAQENCIYRRQQRKGDLER